MTRDRYIRLRNRHSDTISCMVQRGVAEAMGRTPLSWGTIGRFRVFPLADVPFAKHQ